MLIVTHETSPAGQPAKGPLHDPSTGQNLEALRSVPASDDLDDEVQIGRLVHQLEPVVSPVGEQALHPGPALADRIQDHLRARAVGDVGRGQIDHQQTSVRIHGNMPLAPDDLLAGVITSCLRMRCLDALAVDHPGGRARLAT